jgi:hypothetical protein
VGRFLFETHKDMSVDQGVHVRRHILLPLAAGLALLSASGAGAADTNISGRFTYEDCGPGHAVTVPARSTIQLALTLSETTVATEIELRGPLGDVTRSDGTPNSGTWRRDVFTAGTYSLRVCGKQRAIDDPPVSYNGTVSVAPTSALPQDGTIKVIHAKEDTRATLVREVNGAGTVATRGGSATFSVKTVDGAVRLVYRDPAARISIRSGTPLAATFGRNSVTLRAQGVRVMLIDRGAKGDRVVVTRKGYRVAGSLVRGSITVL